MNSNAKLLIGSTLRWILGSILVCVIEIKGYKMRVICVDGGRRPEDIGTEPLLTEGEIYEVESEVYGNTSRGKIVACYKLTSVELPFVYVKDRFIECSDGDGVELENEEIAEQLIYEKPGYAAQLA